MGEPPSNLGLGVDAPTRVRRAAGLFPNAFSLVMATGIVSIDGLTLGGAGIGWALFALNMVMWPLLWLAGFIRVGTDVRALVGELGQHRTGPAFLAVPAATAVLGSQFAAFPLARWLDVPLFAFSVALWAIMQYGFLAGVSEGRAKPSLEQGFSGQWLLLVVATQAVAALGAEVLKRTGPAAGLTFICYALVLLGAIYYLLLGAVVLYRFGFVAMPPEDIIGPWWINEGAAAVTVLAGARLMVVPGLKIGTFAVRDLLAPIVVGFWADATFWIPLLVLLFAWKYLLRGQVLRYSVLLWSVVFPLGMYSAATLALADAYQIRFLHVLARLFFWIAFLAWCATFTGALHAAWASIVRPEVHKVRSS